MSKIEVVGLGALNIDRVYRVERLLTDGEAVADWAGTFPGGSAANTIYGLAKLGLPTPDELDRRYRQLYSRQR